MKIFTAWCSSVVIVLFIGIGFNFDFIGYIIVDNFLNPIHILHWVQVNLH